MQIDEQFYRVYFFAITSELTSTAVEAGLSASYTAKGYPIAFYAAAVLPLSLPYHRH